MIFSQSFFFTISILKNDCIFISAFFSDSSIVETPCNLRKFVTFLHAVFISSCVKLFSRAYCCAFACCSSLFLRIASIRICSSRRRAILKWAWVVYTHAIYFCADMKRAVIKFKKDVVIITFVGEGCRIKYVTKKKPSSSWKKLVKSYKKTGVSKRRKML